MQTQGIKYISEPKLDRPILVAGFGGWGNVLKVSTGLAEFMVKELNATKFATLDTDLFFRYDEARPNVKIVNGVLEEFTLPENAFYAAETPDDQRDIIILKSDEPQLAWRRFNQSVFDLLQNFQVDTIISIGSMYDQVLHTDRIVSGVASSDKLLADLVLKGLRPISYHGPSAIHSILQIEGPSLGITSASLWCHCPFYLQGTVHYGFIAHLAILLSSLFSFEIDISSLDHNWKKLESQIDRQVAENPEVQALVEKLGQSQSPQASPGPNPPPKGQKVIDLQDFLPFKSPNTD